MAIQSQGPKAKPLPWGYEFWALCVGSLASGSFALLLEGTPGEPCSPVRCWLPEGSEFLVHLDARVTAWAAPEGTAEAGGLDAF
jgi:hypothetical protein